MYAVRPYALSRAPVTDDGSWGGGEVEDAEGESGLPLSYDDESGGSCSKFFKAPHSGARDGARGSGDGAGEGLAGDQGLLVHDLLEMTL